MEYKELNEKRAINVAKLTIVNMETALVELKDKSKRKPGWEMETCKLLSAIELQKAHLKELEDGRKTT